VTAAATLPPARPPAFAALQHRGYRGFVIGSAVAMMADNTEHVISYWVLYRKFHSPALGAFAVIAHWVPFLLLSGFAGALADRYNPRRIIQLGMLLFMGVSVGWGLLFLAGTVALWQAWLLLALHGVAGVLWTPTAQLLVHDIVGAEHLQSAVRLNASGRYLGTLAGPVAGNLLMIVLGPAYGMLANALVYLPLLLWLNQRRYTPHVRPAHHGPAQAESGWGSVVATLRGVAHNRQIIAMTLLAGTASLFIGNAYQALMPGFAEDLGLRSAGTSYAALLGADAAGAIAAVLLLEGRSLLPATPASAFWLGACWCLAIGGFALAPGYVLSLPLLFAAGFLELSFGAMAQTIVQLQAPPARRGHIIGLFAMASLGLRAFSGLSVGLGATIVGIHDSLALSAAALLACIALIAAWYRRAPRGGRRAAGPCLP
jgi:Transmembrane secretion effector